jgi:hypothetical protein
MLWCLYLMDLLHLKLTSDYRDILFTHGLQRGALNFIRQRRVGDVVQTVAPLPANTFYIILNYWRSQRPSGEQQLIL